VLEETGPLGARAALELDRATAEMIRGQAEDLALESRIDVTVEECVAMSSHKTGGLLACAGALGALLGGGGEAQVEALRAYGRHLGVAFQAVDDVLGIWGDPAVTGKPAASDLRQHKKTLPVAHALSNASEGSAKLARALSNGPVDEALASEMARTLEELGARTWTLDLASRHLDRALRSLAAADLEAAPARGLREIALFVTGRDF
jgi:geranylgeranyl diphosphate synthase type I